MTKTLKILLIVLAAVIIIAVIFSLAYREFKKRQTTPEGFQRTFTNEKWGYSFKYPWSWYLYPNADLDIVRVQPLEETGKYTIPEISSDAIFVEVVPQPAGQNLDAWIKEKYGPTPYEQVGYNLTGVAGFLTTSTCEGMGCGQEEVFTELHGNFYHIYTPLGNDEILKQVAQSFQFTE